MLHKLSPDVADQRALSVKEACKYISLGRTSFYKLVKSGQIPARKCGCRTIVLADELDRVLESLPRAGRAS
jgi:excisionase family DNA binding protein